MGGWMRSWMGWGARRWDGQVVGERGRESQVFWIGGLVGWFMVGFFWKGRGRVEERGVYMGWGMFEVRLGCCHGRMVYVFF